MSEVPALRWLRWSLFGLAGLGWLMAELLPLILPGTPVGLPARVIAAQPLFAPLLFLLLGWELLVRQALRPAPDETDEAAEALQAAGALRETLGAVELAGDSIARTAWQAKLDLDEQASLMQQTTAGIESAVAGLIRALAALEVASGRVEQRLPDLLAQAGAVTGTLDAAGEAMDRHGQEMARQMAETDTRSAAVAAAAEAAVGRMGSTLAELEEASQRTTQLIANRAYALDAAVTGVLDRSVQVLDSIRESLLAHGRAIETSVKSARDELDSWGREGAADLETRLAALTDRTRSLQAQLDAQQEVATEVMRDLASGLSGMEERLERMREAATAELGEMADGLAAVEAATGAAGTTVATLDQQVATLMQSVAGFAPVIDSFDAGVGARLPAVEAVAGSLEAVVDRTDARIQALEQTLASCAAMLEQLGDARAAEEGRLDALVARFLAARIQ